MKLLRLSLLALASGASVAYCGCGSPFDPANLVESVRLLAISADKPYAAPGDTVNMSALAFDARPPVTPPATPMTVYWVPVACVDPPGDSYFACYPGFAEAGLAEGVDLTSKLIAGTTFSFEMPADAITRHAAPASGAAYGVAFVFAIACAGHVQYVGVNESTLPPAPPLGCFDDTGAALGANDSVFAYAQVFSFADRTNANPVIKTLTLNGTTIDDPTVGLSVPHCPPGTRKCATFPLATDGPAVELGARPRRDGGARQAHQRGDLGRLLPHHRQRRQLRAPLRRRSHRHAAELHPPAHAAHHGAHHAAVPLGRGPRQPRRRRVVAGPSEGAVERGAVVRRVA